MACTIGSVDVLEPLPSNRSFLHSMSQLNQLVTVHRGQWKT